MALIAIALVVVAVPLLLAAVVPLVAGAVMTTVTTGRVV
jgi:hypothetical protein